MSIDDYCATLFVLSVVGVCVHDKLHTLYYFRTTTIFSVPVCYRTAKVFLTQSLLVVIALSARGCPVRSGAPDRHWIYLILYSRTALLLFACINTHHDTYVNTRLLSNGYETILFVRSATVPAFTEQTFTVTITWIHNFPTFFNCYRSTSFERCILTIKKKTLKDIACSRIG